MKQTAWRVALATFLVLAVWPVAAESRRPPVDVGPAFDLLDPTGEVLATVDEEIAGRMIARLKRETRRTEGLPEATFEALAIASSELRALDSAGALETESRPAIGALAMIAVVDALVEHFPEIEGRLAAQTRSDEPSPIEKICTCDRSGSRACGCLVVSTGGGGCQYRVSCGTWGSATCSAVNFEMCIAREVIGIVW
ncbi:MAG TPA: hypothetical protein VD788_06890 [Candidatus Polarisedimenticolaceae bacterium]|nr:hypothetical protein [Candidatus Polarisedimenticolaceae bacterium]